MAASGPPGPPPWLRWTVPAAAAAFAALITGCGASTTSHPAHAAAASTTRPARDAGADSSQSGIQPETLPGLRSTAHLAVLRWRLVSVTSDGRILHLAATWSCGLPPVGQRLEQDSSSVTIAIYDHRLPPGQVCAPALGSAIIAVTLAAPLDGRRLLQ
jgi:hypothetical protein